MKLPRFSDPVPLRGGVCPELHEHCVLILMLLDKLGELPIILPPAPLDQLRFDHEEIVLWATQPAVMDDQIGKSVPDLATLVTQTFRIVRRVWLEV
jgi:hypothetical protein